MNITVLLAVIGFPRPLRHLQRRSSVNGHTASLDAHPMQAAQAFQRRFADLLLFCVTATALARPFSTDA